MDNIGEDNKINAKGKDGLENNETTEIDDKKNELEIKSFSEMGIIDQLCIECKKLGWINPTAIQKKAIPYTLKGLDVIGLAETGSGKTGAFLLPALQALMNRPQKLFCLILAPVRELAYQIKDQVEALGNSIGVKCAVVVGGMDIQDQAALLRKKPHFIVATPGRLLDHLKNTRGFNLKALKFLIIDEADKLLNLDFVEDVNKILDLLPTQRQTLLFSATMTKKIQKLDRAYLMNAVNIEASLKYKTVNTLEEYMFLTPKKLKFMHLLFLLINDGEIEKAQKIIIFCRTQEITIYVTVMLCKFNYNAFPLYGKLEQKRRLASLMKFKKSAKAILVATDVAARGLDIPNVDYVFNYDVPLTKKDYVHRVGRTARVGEKGTAITMITQYDFMIFMKVEFSMNKVMDVYPINKEEVKKNLKEIVENMDELITEEIKTMDPKTLKIKKKRKFFDDNTKNKQKSYKKIRQK